MSGTASEVAGELGAVYDLRVVRVPTHRPSGRTLLPEQVFPDSERKWQHIAERADPLRPYRAVQSSHWVPGVTAPGMELDWFHDQHGALSFLIECSRGGIFGRPAYTYGSRASLLSKLMEPFAWFNPPRPERTAVSVAGAVEPFARGLLRPGT